MTMENNVLVEKKAKTALDLEAKAKKTSQKDAYNLMENKTEEWLEGQDFSGQLAVDVYQTKDDIIIKSTIAGVRTEDIDIAINNDMITIRGNRGKDHEVVEEDYFYKECYWGGFSRSIILPCEVRSDRVKANMKNGVLTIILPKATKVNKVTVVRVKEE